MQVGGDALRLTHEIFDDAVSEMDRVGVASPLMFLIGIIV